MKILLVQPRKSPRTIGGDDVFIYEPLALEYLAAAVAPDHDVCILDLRIQNDLERVMAEFAPEIVGITAYTVHVNGVKALCKQVKTWSPETLTLVGGHHATVMPGDFMTPYIDIVVMGEGVGPFREIVRRHERRESFAGIPGTAVPEGTRWVKVESGGPADLEALPFPDRKLTASYRGRYFSEWMKPLASIRTSCGCPYRCTFCAQWKVAGGRYLKRAPERIVEELAKIAEPFVFFADDESLVDTSRMSTLAKLIKEAGIRKRFFLYGRSDTIARTPALLEQWRGVGLERAFVGLEFIRDEELVRIRKSSSVADNERAVRILQGLDIEIYASFIVLPDFTRQDFAAYRRYSRHLGLDYASFAVLTPLPGTDLYAETKDRLITHDYDLFDFIHTLLPTTLPIKDFYREYRHLYMTAVSKGKQLRWLGKLALRDIPGMLAKGHNFHHRLTTIHQDYGRDSLPGSGSQLSDMPPRRSATRSPSAASGGSY